MDIADPEALPAADHGADHQADENDQIRIHPVLVHQLRSQCTDQADRGTDRQVDVAARQDAAQHTASQNQNV